jgi:hypothetical protein
MRFISTNGIPDNYFFWNINQNVGPKSPNQPEDVQLVQFGYFAMAPVVYDMFKNGDDIKPIFAAVTPGATYDGAPNDPLTLAIRAHQKFRGGTQDGHVSAMKAGTTLYPGGYLYMMRDFTIAMVRLMKNEFPRIDKHPKCPPLVRDGVKRAFNLM